MYGLYTLALLIAAVLYLPRLLWHCWRGATYHRDLRERWGNLSLHPDVSTRGCLWFHAASVGEVQGLQPIIIAMQRRFPALPVVLSTFTPTGKIMAARLVPEALKIFLLPFDMPWIVRRTVRSLQPYAVVVQETELWPNLFRTLAQQGVPIVVVNGRLSPRAYKRYLLVRPFMRHVLAQVALFLVQTEDIAQRFQNLGVPLQRLQVAGNTHIDRLLHAAEHDRAAPPWTSLMAGKRVLVGGSTHEGEETALLTAYQRLRRQYADLLLVLAPRHPERVAAVVRHVRAYGYRPLLRTQCDDLISTALDGSYVVILDTLGELAALYRVCALAFVGGSLVPIGGHNILEPAVYARPVVFGPYMQHYPELARHLCAAGGAFQIRDAEELYERLAELLAHPHQARLMGQRAWQFLQANHGSLELTTNAVADLLKAPI